MELGQPQYRQISLYHPDDSVLLLDLGTNKEVWAFREFRDGEYTGKLQLANSTDVIGADQIVPGTGRGIAEKVNEPGQ